MSDITLFWTIITQLLNKGKNSNIVFENPYFISYKYKSSSVS